MGDAPEKKRRKLTSALKEAIGAHAQKTEENIEKPVALALISDDKSAQDLLNKIQASRRPQAVLEATLKICEEKKTEAHVEEAFLSIFRKHFSILGIDSATSCWKLLETHLKSSESSGEVSIACEFIGNANLLGHGFSKLLQTIKEDLPAVIRTIWKAGRKTDALNLSYSLVTLTVAESVYGESESESVTDYWNEKVLSEKSMKKDYGMKMMSALAGNQKPINDEAEIDESQIELLSKVFLNHLEFFASRLHRSNFCQFLVKSIQLHLESNQLGLLAGRILSSEVSVDVYKALIAVLKHNFEISSLFEIENLETLKTKEVIKTLPSVFNSEVAKKTLNSKLSKKLNDLLDFIEKICDGSADSHELAILTLVFNLSNICEYSNALAVSEKVLERLPKELIGKLVKSAKEVKILKKVQKKKEEEGHSKFANRTKEEVVNGLENSETSVDEAIILLEGVHTPEVKKDIFDAVVKYVEDIPGGEGINEIQLYKIIVEMYGGGPLESLAVQLVFSRLATDGWSEMDRAPGTDQSEESWFSVLVVFNSLLETLLKSAKSSVIKSFTALFCQLFSQALKNTQKFARNSQNAISSKTLSPEATQAFVLRRHKLIQDVSRLVDGMKRNESYFAMLTASIIGDAVFYGSDSLLAMSKLHSLADKNASALLATNLPVVERTRYKKFLSTITKASKRVY